MTDRDARIKELSDLWPKYRDEAEHYLKDGKASAASLLSDASVLLKRSFEALSATGDAEREELAKLHDASAANRRADKDGNWLDEVLELQAQFHDRTAAALRRPVAPVVTDKMVEPANKAYRENEQHGRAFAMKRALETALNVSQLALEPQEAALCKICGDQSGICHRLDQPDCPRKAVAYSQPGVK